MILVAIAVAERLWFDLGQNVELITMTAFVASFYLGKRWGIVLPLVALGTTDVVLGNTSIAFFTWSAYVIIGLTAFWSARYAKTTKTRIVFSCAGGAGAAIWFFLWTNFGVWLLDSWGMYSNDLAGLGASYINGLPFLRNQLVGNMILVPLGVIVGESINAFLRFQHSESSTLGHTS